MRIPFLIISLFFGLFVSGQYFPTESKLIQKVNAARTDEDKVNALGELAEFYYVFRAEKKGDSVLHKQLQVAEVTNDKNLIFSALFGTAITTLPYWTSSATFDRALAFVDKGINYARQSNQQEFEILGYVRKSGLLRKRKEFEKALQEISLALSLAQNLQNDSLRIVVYIEVGDVFLAQGKALEAYKNFNNAYENAYVINNTQLQSEAFHRFSELYDRFNDAELAKNFLLKSLELNTRNKNKKGLLFDYIQLARMHSDTTYANKGYELALELNSEKDKLFCKRLIFSYLMVSKRNKEEAFRFLESNEDLKQSFINSGIDNYYFNLGHINFYAGHTDSALYYYHLAEPGLKNSFDVSIRASVNWQLGEAYMQKGDLKKAISYLDSALQQSKDDIPTSAALATSLTDLYVQTGDYKKAYQFKELHDGFQDSLESLSRKRELALLEVDREKKRYEQDVAVANAETIKLRNLQYIGITIAIAVFFVILILTGMFPISPLVTKMLSFFAFVCLFEFVILLIDNWLHHMAHGDALTIWLAKIGIIAVLLPIHHYLDHAAYKFLASNKLKRLRQRFSIKRMVSKIHVAPGKNTKVIDDEVVL